MSLSASQILTDRYQLALDVGASHLSDTPASGGLDAIEGTGFEFNYSAQFIANHVLMSGDVGVVGLRFFDGSNTDIVSGTLSGRYPWDAESAAHSARSDRLPNAEEGRTEHWSSSNPRCDSTSPSGCCGSTRRWGIEMGNRRPRRTAVEYFTTCGVRYDF